MIHRVIADVLDDTQSELAESILPAIISASELYTGRVARLRPLLEELLWDGLTMLVAKPKAGKSWLTLQLAIYIAGGRGVDGIVAVDSGPVLYAALEEPAARTMARLQQIAPAGTWSEQLHFAYELLPLLGGGAEQLEALGKHLHVRALFVDTLTAVVKSGGKRENDVFRSQYAETSRLRKVAENLGVPVVVVHHTRKGASDSAIEAVAGTGGVAAALTAGLNGLKSRATTGRRTA